MRDVVGDGPAETAPLITAFLLNRNLIANAERRRKSVAPGLQPRNRRRNRHRAKSRRLARRACAHRRADRPARLRRADKLGQQPRRRRDGSAIRRAAPFEQAWRSQKDPGASSALAGTRRGDQRKSSASVASLGATTQHHRLRRLRRRGAARRPAGRLESPRGTGRGRRPRRRRRGLGAELRGQLSPPPLHLGEPFRGVPVGHPEGSPWRQVRTARLPLPAAGVSVTRTSRRARSGRRTASA